MSWCLIKHECVFVACYLVTHRDNFTFRSAVIRKWLITSPFIVPMGLSMVFVFPASLSRLTVIVTFRSGYYVSSAMFRSLVSLKLMT
jgi:hypothetical protein